MFIAGRLWLDACVRVCVTLSPMSRVVTAMLSSTGRTRLSRPYQRAGRQMSGSRDMRHRRPRRRSRWMASLDASNKSEETRPFGIRFIRTEEMKFAWRMNRGNILEVTRPYAFATTVWTVFSLKPTQSNLT